MAFVIRSFPRCGTHMLRTALDSHPEITCHNEVFNPDCLDPQVIDKLGAEGLYRRYTGNLTGFVVHGYTTEIFPKSRHTEELWPVIQRERPTLIIIERQDILRRAFSVYQARHTQRWHVWRSQQNRQPLAAPKLQYQEVEWQLARSLDYMVANRELFPWGHFFTYEAICDDWQANITLMQELIGVNTVQEILPRTAKQDQRPIQDMVQNYAALREMFIDTPYGEFFLAAEANDERRGV